MAQSLDTKVEGWCALDPMLFVFASHRNAVNLRRGTSLTTPDTFHLRLIVERNALQPGTISYPLLDNSRLM